MDLINTLAESKVTSDDIKIKVAEAETTELSIDETREVGMFPVPKHKIYRTINPQTKLWQINLLLLHVRANPISL